MRMTNMRRNTEFVATRKNITNPTREKGGIVKLTTIVVVNTTIIGK
jgi:hypothetical protein